MTPEPTEPGELDQQEQPDQPGPQVDNNQATASQGATPAGNEIPDPRPLPKRRGRPPKEQPKPRWSQPQQFAASQPDPTKPLPDDRREAFCNFVVVGKQLFEAYNAAIGKRVRRTTAKSQASRWLREPAISARVRQLRLERHVSQPETPENSTQTTPHSQPEQQRPQPRKPSGPPKTGAIDRSDLIDKLSDAVYNGTTQEIVSAAGTLLKLMPELTAQKSDTPDPLEVVKYLCNAAGRPGDEIAKELGGPAFLLRKFCHALRIKTADLPAIAAEVAGTPEPDTTSYETVTDSSQVIDPMA